MPATVRATKERDDQATFYKAVAGKKYIQKQPGINPRPGVGWMFSVAYGGQTMPYWKAWYNRSMSASQIAARVAADYTAEIQRRIQVQAQNVAARELWQDTGKQGTKPIPSRELLPTLPAIPQAPERRIALPPIQWRTALEELPAFQQSISRGRIWEELPPLMRGLL